MMKIYLLEVYELGSRQNLFDNQLLVRARSQPGERNFFLDLVSSFDSLTIPLVHALPSNNNRAVGSV
jgi:hypothetical protein